MAEVAIQREAAGKIRMEGEYKATLENDSDSGHSD
jgi:hypothetical protein